MDRKQLESLVTKMTREILAEREQLLKRKKVLFIFCDSYAHESFTDQFIDLHNHHIDYDLLFLDGETSGWLGMNQIQSTSAKEIIAADEYAKAPIELPKDYDAIIVPEIDLDNAARVCYGLKGSIKSEIIFSALLLNIPIIIGEDIPGIKRSDRLTLKTLKLPASYRKRFEQYQTELREFGITFTQLALLAETIKTKLFYYEEKNRIMTFQDKVLTLQWLVTNFSSTKTLILKEGTIITALAQDFIREKSIKLIFHKG